MILKFYELNKIDISKQKFHLFYGNNEGLKREEILKLCLVQVFFHASFIFGIELINTPSKSKAITSNFICFFNFR